jgi:uncharacterized protein with HEPN domain
MPFTRSDPRQALRDIRTNIALAREFIGTLSVAQIEADRLRFYGVTRCLEIISEASRRLPASVRERHAHLPWRAIMGVGNIYRHDYNNVDELLVWETVHDHLPPLLEAVNRELAEMPEQDPRGR